MRENGLRLVKNKNMNNFIKENWFMLSTSFVIIILGLSFYWYQLRPSFIKEECSLIQLDDKTVDLYNKVEGLKSIIIDNKYRKATESEYNYCIHSKGL